MSILTFKASNFRNLKNIELKPCQKLNIFYGLNGSGKTSILESIYYLGLGRSFRSHILQRIINHDANQFVIFAEIDLSGSVIPIGIEKSLDGEPRIKISHNDVTKRSELASILPIQLLNQHSYRLFELGPKLRRQFIDWGLFHVEQSFLPTWRKFERALEQRNAALRAKLCRDNIHTWNVDIVNLANKLTESRRKYVEMLIPRIKSLLSFLLEGFDIDISYYSGWNESIPLGKLLEDSFARDFALGYTHCGPQRADLLFKLGERLVQDVLSRGQLKLLLLAMTLAQGKLLTELTGRRCIYLIDDFAAELDNSKQRIVARFLSNLDAQIFLTGLDLNELNTLFNGEDKKMFHVEHGYLRRD